jgi:hypothetical protein
VPSAATRIRPQRSAWCRARSHPRTSTTHRRTSYERGTRYGTTMHSQKVVQEPDAYDGKKDGDAYDGTMGRWEEGWQDKASCLAAGILKRRGKPTEKDAARSGRAGRDFRAPGRAL